MELKPILAAVGGLAEWLFALYIDCKMSLFLYLQIQYETLQVNYPEKSHPLIEEYRQLMRSWGVSAQELGVVAIIGFSITIWAHIMFNHANFLTWGRIASAYRADIYLIANRQPELADEIFHKDTDKFLQRLIAHNDTEGRNILFRLRNATNVNGLNAVNRILAGLRIQQFKLRQLLYDKSSIWPPNRGKKWRDGERKLAVILYCGIMTHTFCASILIILFAAYYAKRKLIEYQVATELNFAERLFLVEFLFVIHTHKFVNSVTILIMKLRDHVKQMQNFGSRFDKLTIMLLKLRNHNNSEVRSTIQRADSLRMECDREALGLYLNLRVYIDQMKPSIRLINMIANQYSILVLAILIPTLPFYASATTRGQLLLLTCVALDVGLFMNCILLVSASFESVCIKTLNKAWSLVAAMTNDAASETRADGPVDALGNELGLYIRLGRYNLRVHRTQSARDSEADVTGQSIELISEDPSPIASEMASLWHRLVGDMSAFHNRFRCKVFSTFDINHRGILRINFWYVSVILVFVTHF